MQSEDKIKKALNVLTEMCEREKSLVNKFIVSDMVKSLTASFQCMQNTLDSQSNHVDELQESNKVLIDVVEAANNYVKVFESGSNAQVWEELDYLRESLKKTLTTANEQAVKGE